MVLLQERKLDLLPDENRLVKKRQDPRLHFQKIHFKLFCKNKTGSSQVGAISKAQKYSKNNYWKHLEKLFFQKKIENFFSKKSIFLDNRTMPKNSKRGHSGSLNVFTNRKLQKKCKGLPFDRTQKYSKKSRIVPKKTQRGDPLVSPAVLLEA